ncbi:hypothetical protein SAMN05421678_103432 [Actinopolymorpha cephalotaxi]|uniref:Uncharacterized protein n=1 Tax=Actinopolymorpha cephalotaxi TaxID=504797 RepID=A0A1I2NSC4_9ACTN|nr:hypothetical protein SAMN05421678_103432 [Actinopolymorpha cephalotaxi]
MGECDSRPRGFEVGVGVLLRRGVAVGVGVGVGADVRVGTGVGAGRVVGALVTVGVGRGTGRVAVGRGDGVALSVVRASGAGDRVFRVRSDTCELVEGDGVGVAVRSGTEAGRPRLHGVDGSPDPLIRLMHSSASDTTTTPPRISPALRTRRCRRPESSTNTACFPPGRFGTAAQCRSGWTGLARSDSRSWSRATLSQQASP